MSAGPDLDRPRPDDGTAPEAQESSPGPLLQSITNLGQRLDTVKGEVDALQINYLKLAKPWYQDGAILVAALALLFSFGTTLASFAKSWQQEVLDGQAQLTSLIQKIYALPKENAEIQKQFSNDSLWPQLSGGMYQEQLTLAKQAKSTVDRLERMENDWLVRSLFTGGNIVSSNDYLAIGWALGSVGMTGDAELFYNKAIERSNNVIDEIFALRAVGMHYFAMGRVLEGRHSFIQANEVANRVWGANPAYRAGMVISTLLMWAQSEAGQSNCEQALSRVKEAKDYVGDLIPGPYADQMVSQVSLTSDFSEACNQARANASR